MRVSVAAIAALSLFPLAQGCGALIGLLSPDTTRVRLLNNGAFDVDIVLYIDDDQEIPGDLLTEVGTRLEYTVPPGETRTFSRDCDALQAIVIDDADLAVVGQVGPNAETEVLRDGDDFGCGDTIEFTFDHSAVLVDFDISVAVQSN